MRFYQRTIVNSIASLVESGDLTQAEAERLGTADIEETMRYRHPTLDHLSLHDFTTEVCVAAYDLLGIDHKISVQRNS